MTTEQKFSRHMLAAVFVVMLSYSLVVCLFATARPTIAPSPLKCMIGAR